MSTPRRDPSTPTPPLIAKLARGGRGFLGAAKYDAMKAGSELIWTNISGEATPASWSRQAAAFRKLKPNLKRVVDHWSLSLDPRLGKLTGEQWEDAFRTFLDDLGYRDCPIVVHRHSDTNIDHCHATVLRLRAREDGRVEVVSDSNIHRRSHIAAERAAQQLGLKALPPRPDTADAPSPSDAQINANKRATRHRTRAIVRPAALAKTFDSVVSRSANLEELIANSAAVGIEVVEVVKLPSNITQGLKLRPDGVEEWTSASTLGSGRRLAWTKVAARLAANAEIQARAVHEAEAVEAAARARAGRLVASRVARHELPTDFLVVRALLPEIAHLPKEAIDMRQHDKLGFQSEAPLPMPPGMSLDDAPLKAKKEREDARRARERRDHNAAETALDAELRAASKRQLMLAAGSLKAELRAADADSVAMFVARLSRLVIRLLTLNQLVIPQTEAERRTLITRHTISRINGELQRRTRTDTAVVGEVDARQPAAPGQSEFELRRRQRGTANLPTKGLVQQGHDARSPGVASISSRRAGELDVDGHTPRSGDQK